MADAISGIGTSSATSKAATDAQKLADDLDDFMTLLTTQLQHQDPLDPMDATEFTSQLVQFASVEQQIAQNANLETLISAQENAQLASIASYVGRFVEAESNAVQVYNGEAEFNYILHDDAAGTVVTIQDSSGQTLFTTEGNTTMGKHGVVWDGTNLSGQQVPDGVYKLVVSALDADGSPVEITTTTIGKVTGVSYIDDEPQLLLNDQAITLQQVLTLKEEAVTLSEADAAAEAAEEAAAEDETTEETEETTS